MRALLSTLFCLYFVITIVDAYYSLINHASLVRYFQRGISLSSSDEDAIIFGGVKFRPPISTTLRSLNLTDPSPIQKASLVTLTTGLSCILHAETGSGKTLSYLLPILKKLYLLNENSGISNRVRVLIIVPTKELAVQVVLPLQLFNAKTSSFRWRQMLLYLRVVIVKWLIFV